MKRLSATVIFLFVLCVLLAGCVYMPYRGRNIEDNSAETFTVYVCGAVEREGYVTVEAGTSCVDTVKLAGLLPQSILSVYYTDTVTESLKELVVNYADGGKICYCINANSPLIPLHIPIDGLPTEVTELLADYIDRNGAIRNKRQLKSALGEYAEDFHYRFFIAEQDYEADN